MGECTLYVDIENLQESDRQILLFALTNWSADFPKPDMLNLYVKADQTELWRIWAQDNFPSIEVNARGVQHYCSAGSKNSADISLALDALADLLKGRTKYVAIMSDDSDFVSLFASIKQEVCEKNDTEAPFKWLMTDRSATRSQILNDFFPLKYISTISSTSKQDSSNKEVKNESSREGMLSEAEQMAKIIIKNIPVGSFKSSDCKKIIRQYFPNSDMGKEDSATFGTHFFKDIGPILETYGVTSQKPSRGARKYEMTEVAKEKAKVPS